MTTSTTTTTLNESAGGRGRYGLAFAGLVVLHVLALIGGDWTAIAITKRLLMPALLLLVWVSSVGRPHVVWILAIAASWIGDLLLLPGLGGEAFFLGGMGAFAVAHVCYIVRLLRLGAGRGRSVMSVVAFLFCATVASELALRLIRVQHNLVLGLGVWVYGILLAVLLSLSVTLSQNSTLRMHRAARAVAVGATAFVVSDALIALGAFGPLDASLPWVQVAIMVLYSGGQWGLGRLARCF